MPRIDCLGPRSDHDESPTMTIRTAQPGHARVTGVPARGIATPARPGRDALRLRMRGDGQGPWPDRAACRGTDPELFFPVSTSDFSPSKKQVADAKAVCSRCPVAGPCRDWALAHPKLAEFGVWGGLSERERRKALRSGDFAVQDTARQRANP